MTNDLFTRIKEDKGPLGNWADKAEGYFVFPKLEGPISNRMVFNGEQYTPKQKYVLLVYILS